jgi:hypothetical protein
MPYTADLNSVSAVGGGRALILTRRVGADKESAVVQTLGLEVRGELASRFRFARQKSKLAGTIRGSHFVIKSEYELHKRAP